MDTPIIHDHAEFCPQRGRTGSCCEDLVRVGFFGAGLTLELDIGAGCYELVSDEGPLSPTVGSCQSKKNDVKYLHASGDGQMVSEMSNFYQSYSRTPATSKGTSYPKLKRPDIRLCSPGLRMHLSIEDQILHVTCGILIKRCSMHDFVSVNIFGK